MCTSRQPAQLAIEITIALPYSSIDNRSYPLPSLIERVAKLSSMVPEQPSLFVPFRERLAQTVGRTFTIALIPSIVIGLRTQNVAVTVTGFLAGLWFSFGGHWVEMLWLEQLRTRINPSRPIQILCRIGFWFAAGCALTFFMGLTIRAIDGHSPIPNLAVGGLVFIAIELVVHAVLLHFRGRPSVYDGRG